jgi:hypothetical protein
MKMQMFRGVGPKLVNISATHLVLTTTFQTLKTRYYFLEAWYLPFDILALKHVLLLLVLLIIYTDNN